MEKNIFTLKDGRKLIIRKAEENDAEKFLKYFNIVGAETDFLGFGAEGPKISLEEEKEIFKNSTPKNFFLIAEADNKIVGSCSISTNEKRIRSIYFGELGIVVLKDYWGLGIGYNLMKTAIELGKKAGLRKINLDTRDDNEKAIRLYEKLGFKKEGIITRGAVIKGKFYNLLIMGLEIDNDNLDYKYKNFNLNVEIVTELIPILVSNNLLSKDKTYKRKEIGDIVKKYHKENGGKEIKVKDSYEKIGDALKKLKEKGITKYENSQWIIIK